MILKPGEVIGGNGWPTRDLYGYRMRADVLAQLIRDDPPSSIAITSEWGRGKTTFLNTVIKLLEGDGWESTTPTVVLRYEPWKFRLETFDDVWLSIMDDIRSQVESSESMWDRGALRVFRDASEKAAIRRFLEGMGSLADVVHPSVSKLTKSLLEWTPLRQKKAKSHDFFTANREAFRSLIEKAGGRVLLVIDDMDRCTPAASLHILRAVEVFVRSKNLTVFLAMDRDVVLRAMEDTHGSVEGSVEYLHKIIELSITLPRVSAKHGLEVLHLLFGSSSHPGEQGLLRTPLSDFVVEQLLYNPRALERFQRVYRFRWEALQKELDVPPDPWKTAMQSIIEIRWPQWNAVAYRFPMAEERFKEYLRDSTEDLRPYEALLKPFVENEGLCECYRRYFSNRRRAPCWVTASPGRIEIRGSLLDQLARDHGFFDAAALLFLGPSGRVDSFTNLVSTSMARLDDCTEDFGDETRRRLTNPFAEVQAVLWSYRGPLFDCLEDGGSDPSDTLLPWVGLVKAVLETTRWKRVRDEPCELVPLLIQMLSIDGLSDQIRRAIEQHMVLQMESPNSPSSRALQSGIEVGGTPLVAWLKAIEAFTRPNHGLASSDLARLLCSLRNCHDLEEQVIRRVNSGERIPGFGSHEHKAPFEDPRVAIYEESCDLVRTQHPNLWFWDTADELSVAMGRVEERKRVHLPKNPDFYMTLIHLAAGIKASFIPVTFLVARALGWSGYLEELRVSKGK